MYNDMANIELPNGKKLKHTDSDAYPFFWFDSEFYIGDSMDTHIELMQSIIQQNSGLYLNTAEDMVGEETKDDGRIWTKKETIGFYSHIKDNLYLVNMIYHLEEWFGIKINYDKWMIVVQEFYGTIGEYMNRNDKQKRNLYKPKRTHVKSPIDKEVEKRIKTKPLPYIKKKPIEMRYAMGEHKINRFEEFTNEAVDSLYVPETGEHIDFESENAFPFFFNNNELIVGKEGTGHFDIDDTIKEMGLKWEDINWDTLEKGRFWKKYNTLSFWETVDLNMIQNLVPQLEKHFNINITDDYVIEYYVFNSNDEATEILTTIDKMKKNERGRQLKISREEYDKRLENHLGRGNKDKSFGSTLTAWDSNRPLPFRQKIYQENMDIKRFDSFINESKQQEDKINNIIDITVIKPDAQKEDILSAIDLAREKNYYGVVVQPEFVDFLRYEISDEEHIKVVSVLDFPEGEMRLDKKLSEAIDLISNGADEIDMAINIKEFKENHKKEDEDDKEAEYVKLINDLKPIADECHKSGVILKLIVETGMLSMEELVDMCNVIQKSGIDYIQTSTGMNGEGAELSKIKELRRLLPDYVKIKAAGGIRTITDANKLYPYVDRIGTSVALK